MADGEGGQLHISQSQGLQGHKGYKGAVYKHPGSTHSVQLFTLCLKWLEEDFLKYLMIGKTQLRRYQILLQLEN